MSEKFEPSRRDMLKGGAALGAAAAIPGEAQAGIIDRILGREPVEKIADEYHAAEVYMHHKDGVLDKNFQRLRQIGADMKKGVYSALPEKVRKTTIDERIKPVTNEKNDYLKEFDSELIPDLLVKYAQNHLDEKSLVKAYKELGGDVERVRKDGKDAVDPRLVGQIASYMRYDIGSYPTRADYGEATYSSLRFYRKQDLVTNNK